MPLDTFAFPSVPALCPRPGPWPDAATARRANLQKTCAANKMQGEQEGAKSDRERERERERQTITTKLAGWAPAWEDLAQLHSVLTVAPLGTPAPVSAFRIHTQASSHMGDTFTWTSQKHFSGHSPRRISRIFKFCERKTWPRPCPPNSNIVPWPSGDQM